MKWRILVTSLKNRKRNTDAEIRQQLAKAYNEINAAIKKETEANLQQEKLTKAISKELAAMRF
ncbi:MAG: hypothetical protein WC955_07255 [Elusimicrobiota bacterium]